MIELRLQIFNKNDNWQTVATQTVEDSEADSVIDKTLQEINTRPMVLFNNTTMMTTTYPGYRVIKKTPEEE